MVLYSLCVSYKIMSYKTFSSFWALEIKIEIFMELFSKYSKDINTAVLPRYTSEDIQMAWPYPDGRDTFQMIR